MVGFRGKEIHQRESLTIFLMFKLLKRIDGERVSMSKMSKIKLTVDGLLESEAITTTSPASDLYNIEKRKQLYI